MDLAVNKGKKVAEEMVEVQKQQSMVSLFSIPGTDPHKLQDFIAIRQEKALESMKRGHDSRNSRSKNSKHSDYLLHKDSYSVQSAKVSIEHDGNDQRKY